MKRVRISLAALTFILAIAGTTTANANKSTKLVPFCGDLVPGTCTNAVEPVCCILEVNWEPIWERP